MFIKGVKKHGISGFFTGAGKGLAGLVLRPIGGTFDLLNVTFDSVKKWVNHFLMYCDMIVVMVGSLREVTTRLVN